MINPAAKFVHELIMPVRWFDMDAYGHVNTSVYFTYFEQARISWFLEIAPHYKATETGPVVINTSFTFLKSVIFPETLQLRIFVNSPGQTSFETFCEVRSQANPDILYAKGSAKIVWVDLKNSRSTPIPDELRRLLPEK